MNTVSVKICGLSTEETMKAALDAGAAMVGLVSFPKSPRHLELAAMRPLAEQARGRARVVALTVNAGDDALSQIVDVVDPDLIQMHGSESVERVAEVQDRFGKAVIKAVGVRSVEDIGTAKAYKDVADMVLLDAKPAKDATRPGGLGQPFDWRVLDALEHKDGYMLAGGITIENVAHALAETGLHWLDLSSGVETAPGQKDPAKIRAFFDAVRAAEPALAKL